MLEMRESVKALDVLGAREDLGRRGREALKHSGEVDAPQERQGGLAAFSRGRYFSVYLK